jgi:DNA repair exonuclease SbcCD ATPase subunit
VLAVPIAVRHRRESRPQALRGERVPSCVRGSGLRDTTFELQRRESVLGPSEGSRVSTLEELGATLRRDERVLERQAGEARLLAREGKNIQSQVAELRASIEATEEAIVVLNSYADLRQADLQQAIESLVTRGLQVIFEQDLRFHIRGVQKGKLSAMDFVVSSQDGELETPVMDARGGGVAAVAGFLIRLVLLLLKPESRPVLFLDEAFSHVSTEYEPRLAEFMRELVDRTPAQIVLVTHSSAFEEYADQVYRFHLEDGVTVVEEV